MVTGICVPAANAAGNNAILHNLTVKIDIYRLKKLCKITVMFLLDFIPATKIIIQS